MSASVAAPPPGPAATTERLPSRRACLFTLGGLEMAVDVAQAREVVVLDRCTPVPGAPEALLGVTNLRGAILPVVEIRPFLRRSGQPAIPGAMAIVLAEGDWRAALVVDRILGLAWFEEPEAPGGLADPVAGFAAGVLVHEGARLPLLDARRLLSAVRRGWSADD